MRADFLTASTRISIAVRRFVAVRRGICRHLQWPHELPQASMEEEEGEETLWIALSSTCESCHRAYVSLPKATYLAWKN